MVVVTGVMMMVAVNDYGGDRRNGRSREAGAAATEAADGILAADGRRSGIPPTVSIFACEANKQHALV